MTDAPIIELNLPFEAAIKRTEADGFNAGSQIKVEPAGQGRPIRFTVLHKGGEPGVLEPVDIGPTKPVNLEALVSNPDNSRNIFVSFRHPLVPDQMITVLVQKERSGGPGPTGEVDGVWVAEEGGDKPPGDDDGGTGLGDY